MKNLFKALLFVIISLVTSEFVQAQSEPDPPSGYTTNYKLRQYSEGAYPSADSINKNLVDIDNEIKNRDKRIDTLKSALSTSLIFPSGTLKNNIVGTNNIINGAVSALDLSSEVFESAWSSNPYFKKIFDDNSAHVGYGLKTNLNQIDNDSLAIKPGASLPFITVNDYLTVNGILRLKSGGNIASANILTLGSGNYFNVTGTENIDEILTDNFTPGTPLFLKFVDGCELTHNEGSEGMYLQGATNWTTTANDRIIFIYNGSLWEEFARTDN